ncbi:RING finger protein 207 isoform X1 [Osmerus eperlanus]|uniref:RING finger protein 207 isoform X1 n=1 Tax=Osmerus eperlanus TaxID=29151 RepID=UPI002E151E84
MPLGSAGGRRPASHHSICTKVLLAQGGDTPFTQHCRSYENTYRTLQADIQRLKDQVQQQHRDLTRHHSVISTDTMGAILERSLDINSIISSQVSTVENTRATFLQVWGETVQESINEQEIYEAQLDALQQLKQENTYLTTIARQILPYILSIAKVRERLEPRFQETAESDGDQSETTLKVYEDSGTATDKQDSEHHSPHTGNRSLFIQSEEDSPKTNNCHWPRRRWDSLESTNHSEMPL